MLDLAQEMVDRGAAARREALALARAGLSARVRHRWRDVRRAPWIAALPVAIGISTALVTAFLVLDVRGWHAAAYGPRGFWLLGDASRVELLAQEWGLQFTIVGAAVLALASAFGRLWLAVIGALAISAVCAAYAAPGGHLGYVELDLGVTPSDQGYPIYHGTAVTLSGVVGMLLALVVLATFASAAATFRRERPSFRWRRLAVAAAAWLVAVAVLPRLTVMLARAIEPALPNGFGVLPAFGILLLLVSSGALLLAAAVLPRRAPVVATAGLLVSLALLIPTVWVVGGLADPWLEELFGGTMVAALWSSTLAFALLLVLSVAGRAGRAAARKGEDDPDTSSSSPSQVAAA